MQTIQTFLTKWGTVITLFLILIITINTCGVKSHVERLERKITTLENKIISNDSINRNLEDIEMKIYNLKTEKSILFNMNEIVLKNVRPTQRMNDIDLEIEKLQEKIKNK